MLELNVKSFLINWLMSCYCELVSFSLTSRLIELFLLHGEVILIKMGLAIIGHWKTAILSHKQHHKVLMVLKTKLYDVEDMILAEVHSISITEQEIEI